jgi:hypothetical protein
MESKSNSIPSNRATIKGTVTEMLMDWKSLSYTKVEHDFNIQIVEDTTNRLKLLFDGYLQDIALEKIIHELEALKTKLMQDKTTSTGELFEIETKMLNLIEGSSNNPRKLEG